MATKKAWWGGGRTPRRYVVTAAPPVDPPPVVGPPVGNQPPIATTPPLYTTGSSYYAVDPNKITLPGPYPTNSWFENFIVGTGTQPVAVFPYQVKGTGTGLDFCVPAMNTSSSNAVLATQLQNFSFRTAQTVTSQKLTGFSPLGATLTWAASGGTMSAPIVRGMAYVTMNYFTLTPVLNTQNAITAVNGTGVGATGTFTGAKFKFALNNGQTWLLYTSSSVTLTLSTANTLTGPAGFSGSMRLAILPSTTGAEAALDAAAAVIPNGGKAQWAVAGDVATQTFTFDTVGGTTSAAGRTYPLHTNIISTTFWVGELFNATAADGSQVCSTYDSQWAKRWSGKDNGSVAGSGTDCAGAPLGGCDGIPSGSGSSFQCRTEARTAANNFFPTSPLVTPQENPFYLDLPFDDLNDNTGYSTRVSAIPWSGDPGFTGNGTNQNFSYMKNRWVKIMKGTRTCYAQIQDAGPGQYHDATYVFGSGNARPASNAFNNAGMDVSPAVNSYLQFADLDGQNDLVSWQFVDAVDVPIGPWTQVVTTSQVEGAAPSTAYRNAITPPSATSQPLLMYTLPHHRDWLVSPTYPGATLTGLRGDMRAVSGSVWNMTIPLPTVGWNNANPPKLTRVPSINAALATDRSFVPTVGDPYFGGKQLAKAARLALIADQLGDTASRDLLLNNLKPVINSYLTGSALRYDTMWGGIVSTPGLTSQDADFGNGRYNDHHFHYGYAIYAAAVIAKFDTAWLSSLRGRVNDLVRDIANPSSTDPYFTPMRCFDWYEGHSWAAGNFEFGDNRNQESTSEAVNAWYGMHLWGLSSANTQLRDMGRILLASEVATAQKYWQIKAADTIYPSPFKDNGVVGILWSTKVDYATFFGAQPEYIHGIQMLPITPATEVLIPDAWISETWPNILLPLWSRTSVWRAEMVSGGSGYVPAQVSPTGQGYTDGLTASGGSGTGLGFNVNITNGQIIGPYIIYNQHGTGYVNGEIVTLNGSGGTGAQIRVWTQPEDGWKGVLLGAYSQINAGDAWSRTAALTGFDDGSSKTQALMHIASQEL